MSISGSSEKVEIQHSRPSTVIREGHERGPYAIMTAALQAAHAREEALQLEKSELLRRQDILAKEFEHRLVNSLQVVSSLLTLQCRTATTPEAVAQLRVAARRVDAVGRVHCRLHLLDHQERVEFKHYLEDLCDDLARLHFHEPSSRSIVVQCSNFEIPTALGIPLGFIVNELITNATKYAKGNITVRIKSTTAENHSLSVSDGGAGLPAGFDPAKSNGLGMKIVQSLVKQIGGEFHILPGGDGCGARFTITFCTARSEASGTCSAEDR
jgi:two-component system, sensor histidine kinase PdtaS